MFRSSEYSGYVESGDGVDDRGDSNGHHFVSEEVDSHERHT